MRLCKHFILYSLSSVGSVFCDRSIWQSGSVGEGITSSNVLLVKLHKVTSVCTKQSSSGEVTQSYNGLNWVIVPIFLSLSLSCMHMYSLACSLTFLLAFTTSLSHLFTHPTYMYPGTHTITHALTHFSLTHSLTPFFLQNQTVILLVRNPFDAIASYYKWYLYQHDIIKAGNNAHVSHISTVMFSELFSESIYFNLHKHICATSL